MKRVLVVACLLAGVLSAQIIDGISVIVNGSAITMYDVEQKMKEYSIDKESAIDALVVQKLEEQEVKERNIEVRKVELDKRVDAIAAQNGLSRPELYAAIGESRGLSSDEFRDKLHSTMVKQKLYRSIAMREVDEPDEEQLKEYYNSHIDQFSHSKEFAVVLYSSLDQNALRAKITTPMLNVPSVKREQRILLYEQINPKLAAALSRAKADTFLPIVPGPDGGFVAIYLKSKSMPIRSGFEKVRSKIAEKIVEKSREEGLKEYFERAKMKADIKVLR